jgi:predicted permease
MTDFRDAVRSLRATPLVSLVAILSLALGLGANTAMFSIVDALVLRALPVRHAERLALLVTDDESRRLTSWTNPIWEAIRSRPQLSDGAFAWGSIRLDLSERGESDPVDVLRASGRMFDVLGVGAVLGRTFDESDDARGGGSNGAVAIVSYNFWQRKFGGAADVVGRTVSIERVPFTIIGVTSPNFFGPDVGRTFDVAVPLGTLPLLPGSRTLLDSRDSWWLQVMFRLAPGQTAERITASLRAIQAQIAEETRPLNQRAEDLEKHLATPLTVVPAASGSSELREQYKRPVFALLAIVALTLLIACGNIANLLLGRASARRHELSIRTALGASGWRLGRQLFAESLLLSSLGAALGVLFALWGSRVIVSQLSTSVDRVFLDTGIDWRMMAFTGVVSVGTALLFGVAPAFRAASAAPIEAMNEQGRYTSSSRQVGLAGSLVIVQVALSLVLLIGAGLFVRTFTSLATLDLGFDRDRTLVVDVGAQRARLDSAARTITYAQLLEGTRAVPGVSRAALSFTLPVGDNALIRMMAFPGRPTLPERERIVLRNFVTPQFFGTLGTPLVAGRDFDERDRLGAPTSTSATDSARRGR